MVYIDLLLFLNFYLDFLLLMTCTIILKRNVRVFRIILSAFIGSLTILVLFLKITSLQLFFIKIYLSLIMIIVCYGYKNLKSFIIDVATFYILSILLGGFLYFLNLTFKNSSVFLIIVSPIILYLYTKEMKVFKYKVSRIFKTNIYIGSKILRLNGYLDTGNTLTYRKRFVILTNIENNFKKKKIYIPYIVIGGGGVLECIRVSKVEVIGLGIYEDVYLGFSKDFKLGADVLLNGLMKGEE